MFNNIFLKSSRPSLPLKKETFLPLRLSYKERLFSKTYPSFLTVKEGSTSHPYPLSSGAREKTALLGAQNRCALRLADHQRSSPYFAGWDRLGKNLPISDFINRIIHYLKIRNNQSCFMIQFFHFIPLYFLIRDKNQDKIQIHVSFIL